VCKVARGNNIRRELCKVINRRLDDEFRHMGSGGEFDEKLDRGGDVLGLKDQGSPIGSNRNRSGVKDRGFDLAG